MTVIPKSLELLLRIHTHFPQTDILFKVGGAKALPATRYMHGTLHAPPSTLAWAPRSAHGSETRLRGVASPW